MNKSAIPAHWPCNLICLLTLYCIMFANDCHCGQGQIIVKVLDIARPSTEEKLSIGATVKTNEEAVNAFNKLLSKFKKPDLSGIEITLSGQFLPEKITKKTNKEGEVVFEGIPRGHHEVVAETEVRENGKSVKTVARACIKRDKNTVFLRLSTDWVTLKGKVLNADGTPVTGARIRLEPIFTGQDSGEQYDDYPQQIAVSGADGSYTMPYIKPLSVDLATGYLINSNAVERSQNFFYGLIYAKKSATTAYTPPRLQIPLISEDILKQARRCVPLMDKNFRQHSQENRNVYLPESKGDVIFLPDIIIDDDKSEVLPAAKDPKTKQ